MSYRNDHDAALARVDALAAENETLAAENAKLRAGSVVELPSSSRRRRRGAALVASLVALGGITAVAVLAASAGAHPRDVHRLDRFDVPMIDDTPAQTHATKADLQRCASKLVTAPDDHDAPSTDPRGADHGVSAVMGSTGCRDEIRDVLATGVISPSEREALVTWGDAEAHLDATVSMVGEYYRGDPYALDSYSTAPQLWTEYNRALVIRNESLEEWRRAR